MTQRLRKILVPNLVMFLGLLVLLIVGTLVAIPGIQKVFEEVGSEDQLPKATLWFKGVLDNLVEFWYIPTFIILAIIVGIYIYKNSAWKI